MDGFLAPKTLSAAELHEELTGLLDEFDGVGWDREFLWMTTDRIVLEHVCLGRFRIKLRIERVGRPLPGDCVIEALVPNRPVSTTR